MTNERDKAFEEWFEKNGDRELIPIDNKSIGYIVDRSVWIAAWDAREKYEGEAGLLKIDHVCPKCEFTRGINGFCGCSIVKSNKNVNPKG